MASEAAPNDSFQAPGRRITNKRKRATPASRIAAQVSRDNTPNAYARRSPPREPAPIDDDGDHSPPRKLKRPGASSRLAPGSREAAEKLRQQREADEARNSEGTRPEFGAASVAAHYNAVPERGRDWRQTDSRIKGLRSLNNWIKSTLIQKFSRPDNPVRDLKVLDMACGKGGDLGKWEKAPQVPAIYVGCDIADVSIDQARERYAQSQRGGRRFRPPMRAEFYVQDTFGHSLSEVPAVPAIGFNPNAGPGSGIIQGAMMTGGFDVVSMMFALHYSFESEELARGMLRNVSGALKKGGRFIGVLPNSDVITRQVKALLSSSGPGKTPNGNVAPAMEHANGASTNNDDEDDWDPEKPSERNDTVKDGEWDPEKPSDPQQPPPLDAVDDDDWDPEKPSEPANVQSAENQDDGANPTPNVDTSSTPVDDSGSPLLWGNDIYNIRFPRQQTLTKKPLPRDGIFRPPFGWKYHYSLEEAVNAPEYVVPWEAFRALAEDYGLELMYRKGFREVLEDESTDRELGMLAERMNVMRGGRFLVSDEEMEAASFYHAFCFYKT